MVEQPEFAWRILEITALALPAMAILVQALIHLDRRAAETPRNYSIITIAAGLTIPISLSALVAIGAILHTYRLEWLGWALIPMGIAYIFLPAILISRWRTEREHFVNEYLAELENEIVEDLEEGEESKEDVEDILNRVRSHRKGLLWNFRNPDKSIVVKRMNVIFATISILSALVLLYADTSWWINLIAVIVIIYSATTFTSRSILGTITSRIE